MSVRSLNSFTALFLFILWPSLSGAGDTPLHTAALAGDITAAKKLIAEGADINVKDQSKKTPIQLAIEKGHADFCRWYVSLDPIMSARDKFKLRQLGVKSASTNRPPPATDKTSVYDDVARATGGTVYKPEKGMSGMADIMLANMGSQILLNREINLSGVERISLPVEEGLGTLMFSITGVRGKPVVTVKDPLGKVFDINSTNSRLKVVSLKNGVVYIFKEPRSGNWSMAIKGSGNVHVQAKIKQAGSRQKMAKQSSKRVGESVADKPYKKRAEPIDFYKFEFVEIQGRPGHQGYFETKRPLVPGQEMVAWATVFGSPKDVHFRLIQKNGKPFSGSLELTETGEGGDGDYFLKVRIPKSPFRVLMTGKDGNGKSFQRTYGFIFNPERNWKVYRFKPKEKLSTDDCMAAQAYLQLMDSKNKKSSAFIRCSITAIRPLAFEVEVSFYIQGSQAKAQVYDFHSDPRYKFKSKDCERINIFFSKIEDKTRAGASLKATCTARPAPGRLKLNLSVK